MKIDNIDVYLRDNGVNPSYQRTKIFEYMQNHHIHPTVNEIYEALVPSIPTLSKTTVYNTLNLFVEKRIVELVNIEGNESRYEIYSPEEHAHFKCEKCERIYDIPIDFSNIKVKELEGFQIKSQQIHFIGICRSCSKNK